MSVWLVTYVVDDGRTPTAGPVVGGTLSFCRTTIVAPSTSQRVQRRHTRLTVCVDLTRFHGDLRHLTKGKRISAGTVPYTGEVCRAPASAVYMTHKQRRFLYNLGSGCGSWMVRVIVPQLIMPRWRNKRTHSAASRHTTHTGKRTLEQRHYIWLKCVVYSYCCKHWSSFPPFSIIRRWSDGALSENVNVWATYFCRLWTFRLERSAIVDCTRTVLEQTIHSINLFGLWDMIRHSHDCLLGSMSSALQMLWLTYLFTYFSPDKAVIRQPKRGTCTNDSTVERHKTWQQMNRNNINQQNSSTEPVITCGG